MTTHLNEDDLVLHYYGELAGREEQRVATHLASCSTCRHEFTRLQRALGLIEEATLSPVLPDDFEQAVWARLVPDLRRDRRSRFSWLVLSPVPLALAAAVLVLVGAAFFAGRMSSPHRPAAPDAQMSGDQVRERILLVDLGEHLERSQMILVELVSSDREAALVSRENAEQLLRANRLYRQTAATSGETAIGDLLDELERVLVELAAAPEQLSSGDLEGVRTQIEGKGLLFKVRVVSSEIRNRQEEAIKARTSQRTSTGV